MTLGVWVLGNQLWQEQAALVKCQARKSETPVFLIESLQFARERPYHQQKLVLVWSAMRHFSQELKDAGWPVTYENRRRYSILPGEVDSGPWAE